MTTTNQAPGQDGSPLSNEEMIKEGLLPETGWEMASNDCLLSEYLATLRYTEKLLLMSHDISSASLAGSRRGEFLRDDLHLHLRILGNIGEEMKKRGMKTPDNV